MHLRQLLVLSIIFVTVSCSTTHYVVDSLGPIDKTPYHTYTMEDNCADDINPIMQIRIKNALEQNFRDHDFSRNSDSDLLIKYFVKNTEKKYLEECIDEYERWEGGRICKDRVVNYVEGSIVIDIIDTKSNTIIWHGAAYGPSWSKLSDPNKKVNAVVKNLLDKFFDT